jgi:hypothetical protein
MTGSRGVTNSSQAIGAPNVRQGHPVLATLTLGGPPVTLLLILITFKDDPLAQG